MRTRTGRVAIERGVRMRRSSVHVEHLAEVGDLRAAVPPVAVRRDLRRAEQRLEVEPARLPVIRRGTRLDDVDAADHLLEATESEPGHPAAHVLGKEQHERDDMLGPPGEPGPQHAVLRRDADRAGVEVADAHHHAARGDQRRGRERELVRTEQGADHHVAPGLHLTVGLQRDAAAQPLTDEHLLGLGKPELPRHAGVLDGGERRRARCRPRSRR